MKMPPARQVDDLMPARIIWDKPPNYNAIVARFGVLPYGVIFAWGDRIYIPDRVPLPPQLVAHEDVHRRRQGDDPQAWWDHYLVDASFRLSEEIVAHVAEYRAYCDRHKGVQKRAKYLTVVTQRMASPIYGSLMSAARAREIILGVLKEIKGLPIR